MKYIRQMTIILSVTCVAEILKYFIPLPIPASIYHLRACTDVPAAGYGNSEIAAGKGDGRVSR